MNRLASTDQKQCPQSGCAAASSLASAADLVAGLGRDAVLVVDGVGRLIYGNATGKGYLNDSAMVRLAHDDHVHFVDYNVQDLYQKALMSVTLGAQSAVFLDLGPEFDPAVQVSVCEAQPGGKELFILRIRNLAEARAARVQHAVACFGLTPAESRVLHATLNGLPPASCAKCTGLKISTVRTHLAALFAKTQTSGQAQLIVKVMNLPEL